MYCMLRYSVIIVLMRREVNSTFSRGNDIPVLFVVVCYDLHLPQRLREAAFHVPLTV